MAIAATGCTASWQSFPFQGIRMSQGVGVGTVIASEPWLVLPQVVVLPILLPQQFALRGAIHCVTPNTLASSGATNDNDSPWSQVIQE